jgi:hypothetical protein
MRTRTGRLLRVAAVALPGLALVAALVAPAVAHSSHSAKTQAQGSNAGPGDPRGVSWA